MAKRKKGVPKGIKKHKPRCAEDTVPFDEIELKASRRIQDRIDECSVEIDKILSTVPKRRGKTARQLARKALIPEQWELLVEYTREMNKLSRTKRQTKKTKAKRVVYPPQLHETIGSGRQIGVVSYKAEV